MPQGVAGERFEAVTTGLVSARPRFVQKARSTVFLDVAAGVLAVRDQTVRLDLGARSPGEILDAVLATAPGTERIAPVAAPGGRLVIRWTRSMVSLPVVKSFLQRTTWRA